MKGISLLLFLHFKGYVSGMLRLLAGLIALSLVVTQASPALAAGGQNGNLNGTIVDSATHSAVAGAAISAASPTSHFAATTDARGFFSINGLNVDTYTVSVTVAGYETVIVNGVNIQGDQTVTLGSISLSKQLRTIGRVGSRSSSSVFQPSQSTDQYTVTGDRIVSALGKTASTDENSLALSIPGVQLTNASQLLTIRGGMSDEVGYQLDGVSFTEPFLNGSASNGFFNGLGSLQVVEGAGDASQGNIGAGVINIIPKRGTRPASGLFDIETTGPNYGHQLQVEYGFATPDNRFSDYFSYNGQRYVPYYGNRTTDFSDFRYLLAANSFEKNDDFINNFVYKFGRGQNQSFQVLYENRNLQTYGDASGLTGRVPYYENPYSLAGLGATPGDPLLDPANLSNALSRSPNVNSGSAPSSAELNGYNPTTLLKFEYDNNLNESTFLSLKEFNVRTIQGGTAYYNFGRTQGAFDPTGGYQAGFNLDITKTLSSRHTATFGIKLNNIHPIWDGENPYQGIEGVTGGTAGTDPTLQDFLALNADGSCPVAGGCYLTSHGVTGVSAPVPGVNNGTLPVPGFGVSYNKSDFQDYGVYIRDQWTPNTRLSFDLGARLDGRNWKQGASPFNADLSNPDDVPVSSLNDKVVHPRVLQPRTSISYKFGANDALRFGYSRSVIFANSQTVGTPGTLSQLNPQLFKVAPLPGTNLASDPSTWSCGSGLNPQHGGPASGSGGNYFRCTSYAQQLYWLYDRDFDAPDVGNNLPEQLSNTDLTYQHQFRNGFGLRLTPYYKRGFSVPVFSIISQVLDTSGAPISQVFGVSNTGVTKTTGIELGVTSPEPKFGLSGYLSATYTNVLSAVPPLVSNEDSLPLVPAESVILGNVYRAGYISPFTVTVGGQYKMRNGFRINPVLYYTRGYPTGVGNLIATAGYGAIQNLPQTNLNSPSYSGYSGIVGSYNATNYVDPVNTGSIIHPNIAATRGTPETSSAGGYLTAPTLDARISFEYTLQRNTFGIQFENLASNLFHAELYNPYWQPVATGVGGPATGTTASAAPGSVTYVYGGFRNIPSSIFGQTPYVKEFDRPLNFRFYYQLKL